MPRAAVVYTDQIRRIRGNGPRLLYVHLCGLADREGIAWQAHQRMAADLGISRSTLYAWQADLEAQGFARRVAGGHRGRIVRWIIVAFTTAGGKAIAAVRASRRAATRSTGWAQLRRRFGQELRADRRASQASEKGSDPADPTHSTRKLIKAPPAAPADPLDLQPPDSHRRGTEISEIDGLPAYRDNRTGARAYTARQKIMLEDRRRLALQQLDALVDVEAP